MSENPYADRLYLKNPRPGSMRSNLPASKVPPCYLCRQDHADETANYQIYDIVGGHRPMPVAGLEGLPRWLYAVCAHQCLSDGLGAV
jgi:hypothetical protein